jgi:hypothetical protein
VVDVSTASNIIAKEDVICCSRALHEFIHAGEAGPELLRADRLPERLSLLDKLDAIVGYLNFGDLMAGFDAAVISRAERLKARLESANERLYESARSEIVLKGSSRMLRQWLLGPISREEAETPWPGLGFDLRDEIVGGVLQLREPKETELPRSSEMVPYQPTPARHVLDLIAASNLSRSEVFVDLGSGMGHVPLLVSILTGCRTLGVELQPAYVASAEECAARLNLHGSRFVASDARVADLASGTVFYLFSPFTGRILIDVLDRLQMESLERRVRVCSLGPCTRVLADQRWLKATTDADSGRIAVFESE